MLLARPGTRILTAAIAAMLLVLALATSTGKTASAHGEVEATSPRANAVLPNAPEEVVISLTEAPDPAFSEIRVFDKNGVRVDKGDTRLSEERSLSVGLSATADGPGTYTVLWQTTSVVDAHRTSGSFRFTVSGGGRLFLGTGGGATQSLTDTRPTILNTTTRWGELVGLALIVGTLGTLAIVWRLVLPTLSTEAQGQISNRMRRLALVGLGILVITLVVNLLDKASSGGFISVLTGSQTGTLFMARLFLTAVLGFILYRSLRANASNRNGSEAPYSMWAAMFVSALLLLGRSLESHAAASENGPAAINITADFVHLAAAGVWTGGLVALLAGIEAIRHTDRQAIGKVVSRFSNLAIVSVAAIGLTGLYNAWLEVGSLRALLGTSYGQLLLVKSAIVIPLLGLGGANLLGIRFGALRGWAGRGLRLSLRGEVTLALVILVITALLANMPLARDAIAQKTRASEAPMAMPLLLEEQDLNVTFGVTPNRVGGNTLLLELTDALGNPVSDEVSASVQLSRLDSEVLAESIELKLQGQGQMAVRSNALSIVGSWRARVTFALDMSSIVSIDYVFRVADRARENRSVPGGIADFLTGQEPQLPRTGPLIPAGVGAEAGLELLRRADAAMNRLSSLHECNNINGVITVLDYGAPNLMRYAVKGGGTSIIAGESQWYRRGGSPWQEQPRSNAFRFPDFNYAEGASGVRLEGEHELGGRTHHLVSFYSPRDEADYWFWIDAETFRLSRLLMNVPPSHYMVSVFDGFDAPRVVSAPSGPDDFTVTGPPIGEDIPCQSYLP